MKVVSNQKIANETYELIVAPDQPLEVKPGQFLHLKTGRADLLLRRPISIAKYEGNQIHLVYKVVGAGTQVMSDFTEGMDVDCLGPLGKGFDVSSDFNTVLIVGGGMGVAPLYELGRRYVQLNKKVTFVLGFQSAAAVYYLELFKELGDVHITTDDGSIGVKGNVGAILPSLEPFDAIYACGPLPLLHLIKRTFETHPHCYLSLEERMACGIGACYACDTKDKKHRVCKDGPVFNAQEVEL